MSLRDDLVAQLKKSGLASISGPLLDLSKDCIRMNSTPDPSDNSPTGSSKLGGLPDLPFDHPWPEWKTGHLHFVAQLNLAELPPNGLLPNAGVLSYFYDRKQSAWGYDPKHRDGFRLLYFPDAAHIVRTQDPQAAPFPCARLSFEPSLSLPNTSVEGISDLLLETDDDELYYDFIDKRSGSASLHQILGWAHVIQNEMELECQLVTNGLYVGDTTGYNDPRRPELEPGASDWTLLLQFDSDDNARMMWGDVGMLYVWIRRQDLAARMFDKAWTVLQCC